MFGAGHLQGRSVGTIARRRDDEFLSPDSRNFRDSHGRPLVAVTGLGIVTSLGQGQVDNWTALTAGRSGIHSIARFSTDGLRTRIAGTVDFLDTDPLVAPALSQRFAEEAAEEAITQSGIGTKGNFPGALFIAVPPVEMEWPQRQSLAQASGQNGDITYSDLQRAASSGRFDAWHDLFIFATVADNIADRFGTKGSPISLSTACSSGATAIQLGVEAIRRGEMQAALCIGTDGSVNPESLIRFSLLSALSTQNDPPEGASKPFSKNRDGFVMGEGPPPWSSRMPRQRVHAARRSSATFSVAARRVTAFTVPGRARTGRPASPPSVQPCTMLAPSRIRSTRSTPTARRRRKMIRWRRWAALPYSVSGSAPCRSHRTSR